MTRPDSLPRLLAGLHRHTRLDLAGHLETHGPLRLEAFGDGGALIAECDRAGLLRRGGAMFPLAPKMEAVVRARGRAVVVANGTDGEPISDKDRIMLMRAPHLVLD